MSNQITSPESVGLSSARLARVAPAMESYVTERGVVGISTMVARRGEIVHAEQFGFQDKEAGTPMAPDTMPLTVDSSLLYSLLMSFIVGIVAPS